MKKPASRFKAGSLDIGSRAMALDPIAFSDAADRQKPNCNGDDELLWVFEQRDSLRSAI